MIMEENRQLLTNFGKRDVEYYRLQKIHSLIKYLN